MTADSKNLREQIYEDLIEDIAKTRIKPGEILNEKKVIERFSVSKSPVREALLQLASDGVLKVIPRYGYEVIRIGEKEIREMLHYRRILECGFLQEYGKNITCEEIANLEKIDEACAAEQSIWKHWEKNTEFHLYLMKCSKEDYTYHRLEETMGKLRIAYAQAYQESSGTIYSLDTRHHQRILEALKNGNIEDAVKNLSADLQDFGGLDRFV